MIYTPTKEVSLERKLDLINLGGFAENLNFKLLHAY